MAYSAHASRATQVPVLITSGKNRSRFTVDQTIVLPTGKLFRLIGTTNLTSEAETVITVNNAETDGFVILDALQLIPTGR